MVKDFKEVAHLYLGCKFTHPALVNYRILTGRLLQNYLDGGMPNIKPVLRPLSDMTEQEAFGLATLRIHPMGVLEILHITNDGIEFKYESFEKNRKMHVTPDELSPEMFRLLLKARFDLFGLIESGLAIPSPSKPNGNEKD